MVLTQTKYTSVKKKRKSIDNLHDNLLFSLKKNCMLKNDTTMRLTQQLSHNFSLFLKISKNADWYVFS